MGLSMGDDVPEKAVTEIRDQGPDGYPYGTEIGLGIGDDDPMKPVTEIRDQGPDGYPYGFFLFVHRDVGIDYDTYLQIRAWCGTQFGPERLWEDQDHAWAENRHGIWFKDPVKAMEFKLRWV